MGLCSSIANIITPREPEAIPIEPIGRIVGSVQQSFILIRNLGSGSFGNVFLVKDRRTGLERAAKELIKAQMIEGLMDNYFMQLSKLKNLVIFYIGSSKRIKGIWCCRNIFTILYNYRIFKWRTIIWKIINKSKDKWKNISKVFIWYIISIECMS